MTHYTGQTAFLELGSTTIKLYVISTSGERAGEVEHEEKVPWDLGYDVFEHGRISPRSISRCLETLRRFQGGYPEIVFATATAVGTSALREAQNVEVFRRLLWEELRLKIHIIEGGIEAFLLETGFRDMVETYPTGLFDLGGGSLELIEYLGANSTRKTSLPLGAIRLHCQLRRARDLLEYIRRAREIVGRTIEENLLGQRPVYPELIGTGGTVRAIVSCIERDEIAMADVQELIQREVAGPVWPQLKAHRRRLLLPGLLATEGVMETLRVERIVLREASVKRGLISFTSMLPSMA